MRSFKFFTQHTFSKRLLETNSSELQSSCVIAFQLFPHSVFLNTKISIAAHTGGLLTLFLGFSAVSMVEIFYFIAMRSYCNRHANQQSSEMQEHLPKSNYKSKVPRLTTQNQIWPYTRTHGRTHLDTYGNHQSVAYRRRF